MAKRKAEAAPREQAQQEDEDPLSSVVYIGHIPHGFYEKQMKEYFSQFGKVNKLRLSRNKKTGKSKHYAFLEFQSAEVAKVVADAMDGYMFFGQKLQSRAMRRSEVHEEIFKGANRVFKRIPWKKIETERHNKDLTPKEAAVRSRNAAKRDRSRRQRIKEAGIEYEFQEATNTALSPADAEKPEADRKVHSSDDKARGSRKNKETVPDTKPSKTTANQIGKIEATETKRRKVEVPPPAPTTASGRPRRVKKA